MGSIICSSNFACADIHTREAAIARTELAIITGITCTAGFSNFNLQETRQRVFQNTTIRGQTANGEKLQDL